MVQELVRFTKADFSSLIVRPFRYCALFDSYPLSRPYVARFHANKVLKFQDALLTSYHKNEVLRNPFILLLDVEFKASYSFKTHG